MSYSLHDARDRMESPAGRRKWIRTRLLSAACGAAKSSLAEVLRASVYPLPEFVALILLCLVTAQAAPAQSWPDEHTSGPFAYHADFSLQPHLPLLQDVSELSREVTRALGVGSSSQRIHVFLFQQPRTYRHYLETYFPNVPRRQALFVKHRGPGMVFAHLSKDIDVDLRHEATHAVLHSVLPHVPLWLDEGLAEYFEFPAETRAYKHPHLRTVRFQARFGWVPELERLEALDELAHMRIEHYRDAWAWVHFMLHGPDEARLVLRAFLRDLEAQVPPGQLSARMRRRLPNLERRYLDHFRHWKQAHAD